jgi:hypothetical protein
VTKTAWVEGRPGAQRGREADNASFHRPDADAELIEQWEAEGNAEHLPTRRRPVGKTRHATCTFPWPSIFTG